MRKIAFPPIIDCNSSILLLGTMPSEESLRKQQYYGHKSNHFWKILFSIFGKPFSENYEDRVTLLGDNNIALWDVLCSCGGTGSADSNIKEEEPNNFSKLFDQYPQITHVAFTSKKAEEFYKKYVGFIDDKKYITLPSPSPAHARMSLQDKIDRWHIILDII